MRAAVDTNVLIYAEGFGDGRRVQLARAAVDKLTQLQAYVSTQVCAEYFYALTRKFHVDGSEVKSRLEALTGQLQLVALSADGFAEALELAAAHSLQIFDAMILAGASECDCRLLLSEDMQDGFVWQGVTVVNPFAPSPHNLLKSYLATTS